MPLRQTRFLQLFLLVVVCGLGVAAQSPQTGAFTGTVVDEEGQPLVGATVIFSRLDYEFERRVETDAQGRFFHGGFHAGPYRLTLLRDGHAVWSTQTTMPGNGAVLEFAVDLKKMREEAERRQRLDPELRRRRQAEREREAREEELEQHYLLATRYRQEGRADDAIREFQAALELDPGNATLHSLLGLAYAEAGRLPEAIASHRRALELQPGEAAHHNNLGTLLVRSGEWKEGVRHIEQAARRDPEQAATCQFNVAAALLNADHAREAVEHFRAALRSDPTLAVANFFLGVALVRSAPQKAEAGSARAAPGAAEAFQRYLQLAPEGEYAERAREYLKQLGSTPEAAPARVSPAGTVVDRGRRDD
ncbi:MAG: tetratricopeptide repeat protein [Acidobacteria bacterium]|nr:tetratricopeptide repeat protein [Acidobacteriota bacterium]